MRLLLLATWEEVSCWVAIENWLLACCCCYLMAFTRGTQSHMHSHAGDSCKTSFRFAFFCFLLCLLMTDLVTDWDTLTQVIRGGGWNNCRRGREKETQKAKKQKHHQPQFSLSQSQLSVTTMDKAQKIPTLFVYFKTHAGTQRQRLLQNIISSCFFLTIHSYILAFLGHLSRGNFMHWHKKHWGLLLSLVKYVTGKIFNKLTTITTPATTATTTRTATATFQAKSNICFCYVHRNHYFLDLSFFLSLSFSFSLSTLCFLLVYLTTHCVSLCYLWSFVTPILLVSFSVYLFVGFSCEEGNTFLRFADGKREREREREKNMRRGEKKRKPGVS